MSVAKLIQDMVEEGISAEIIGRTAELLAQRDPVQIVDEQAERRRAKDRERKRLRNSAEQQTKEKRTKKENNPLTKENPPTGVKRKVSPKGSRLSEGWQLPIEWGDWARAEGMDTEQILAEEEKFRDYWLGVGGQKGVKLDWQATWRNWIRRAMEYKNGN